MKLLELIKNHEGLRLTPYHCTANKLTIGYGINLDAGITEEEAEYLLKNRVHQITVKLQELPFWMDLSGVRRAIMTDMAYNLGITGLYKFKRMLAAIKAEDFEAAAEEMEDSSWFKQVGARSRRLQRMMISNKWE